MNTEPLANPDNISGDLLKGAAQIAAFTGDNTRRVNHLLDTHQLPAFKIGNRWHMRKSTFRAFIERKEAEAA